MSDESPDVHEKLKKIREKDDLEIQKDSQYLKDDFELRNYQKQMVLHMLLMKRFVVGDATGIGKCCSGDTMVRTNQGLVPIEDMHDWSSMEPDDFEDNKEGWEVLLDGEYLPVKNFYYGGKKPTFKVQTRYGFEVEGTYNHPILVWRDEEHQWVETQDLQVGDYVCIERKKGGFPDEEPKMDTNIKTEGGRNVHELPEKMNPNLARFLGYYIGEGRLSSEWAIELSQCPEENPSIHEDIINLISNQFGEPEICNEDGKDFKVYSVYLREFLYENGLDYTTSHNREVPSCILRSTEESSREFLRGIFEGEGHVGQQGTIELTTASRKLANQVQTMLLQFGVVTNKSSKEVKGYEHNNYYRLTISGRDADLFEQEIGFISKRKRSSLKKITSKQTNCNHDVVPNAKPLIEDLRNLLKEAVTVKGSNEERKGSGMKQFGRSFVSTLYNIRNKGRDPTYEFIKKFLEISKEKGLEDTDPFNSLEDLVDSHYFYDPVETLEESSTEVYDLEVPDKHSFVGNGLVNHNTAESIATMGHLWEKNPNLKCLIVTNTSAMRQWGSEIDKFTEGVDWRLVEGGPEDREKIYKDYFNNYDPQTPEALIVNYNRIRRDKRDFLQYAQDEDYVVIADEATAFKNPSSKTHSALKSIARHANRIYGLTATLIKNNLEEGFGIFNVIKPSLFPSKSGFMRNYCITRMQRIKGGRKIPIIVGHSSDQVKKFKDRIDPYYLGRAKHEVADELPVLTTKDIDVRLNRNQWQYYLQALEGFLSINEDDDEEESELKETTHLTELIYTQQIVDSPYLIGNEVGSEKTTYLLELLDNELSDEKVIIFTRFKEMVNRLEGILENRGYDQAIEKVNGEWKSKDDDDIDDDSYVRITGDEDDEQREAGKTAFKENDNTNVIFLTMAGAEAINLQQARIMVFFDLPWSAGDYLQLIGRMIRIGSPHESVYSLHLLSEGPKGQETIDEHVRDTLDDKMGLIENVIGERVKKGSDEEEEDVAISNEKSETQEIFEKLKESAKELN